MLRCSAVIFSTLTPGPSSTSYRVTVGPRVQPVTAASTLNCCRTELIESAIWSLAALRFFGGSPATSRLRGGRGAARRPPLGFVVAVRRGVVVVTIGKVFGDNVFHVRFVVVLVAVAVVEHPGAEHGAQRVRQ